MKPFSNDTSPEAQRVMFQLLREVPPSKKIELTFDLIDTTRLLVLTGLTQRFPNADRDELRRRFISKLLPRDAIIEVYGFDPDELS